MHMRSGMTAIFKKVIDSTALVLIETDGDFQSLIMCYQDLNVTTPQIVSFVCVCVPS